MVQIIFHAQPPEVPKVFTLTLAGPPSIFSFKNEPGDGSEAIRSRASFRVCLLTEFRGRGADQREAAVSREQRKVLSLHLPAFPSHSEVFGTARSRPGRAVCARRRKIFSGVEKIFRSAPWTARTVLEHG